MAYFNGRICDADQTQQEKKHDPESDIGDNIFKLLSLHR